MLLLVGYKKEDGDWSDVRNFLNEQKPIDKNLNFVFISVMENNRALIIKDFADEQKLKDDDLQFGYVNDLKDERILMACADFYIANRDIRTIYRSELADDYNVKILSAVDHKIF